MIGIYCHGHGHSASGICSDCGSLLRYACGRIESCPCNAASKPVCGLCRNNCFTTDMYRQFTGIMRYSGSRMMLRHPLLTMAHVWDAVKWQWGNPKEL